MQIKINPETVPPIIEISGRLDRNTAADFEKRLAAATDRADTIYVLDFTRLDYISSTGLRILYNTLKNVQTSNGDFVIFGMQKNIGEVFRICGFSQLFSIKIDKSEALAAAQRP